MALKKSEVYSSLWQSCDELRGGMDASHLQGLCSRSALCQICQRQICRCQVCRNHRSDWCELQRHGCPQRQNRYRRPDQQKDPRAAVERQQALRHASRYLLYSLMFQPVKSNLFMKIGGSTVGHAKGDDIRFLQLPLPPIFEQCAIAEALSDADALIESLEQIITKKRQIKQGAMQELLTGKKRLPGFSGEWEVKRLGDLFSFSGGYSASRDQLSSECHCYLHYGDIHGSLKNDH
jgi:hypothetical protein